MDRVTVPAPAPAVGLAALLVIVGACSAAPAQRPGVAGLDRRVALARVVVVNQTDRTLAITFRYAVRPSSTVEVGRVRPGTTAEVAPVPAEEPIILEATGEGLHWRLEPRILEMDAVWTWTIEGTQTDDR